MKINRGFIFTLMLIFSMTYGIVGAVEAISFNATPSENSIYLNVSHSGEYQAFLNEEWKFNSSEEEVIFSELETDTMYKIRVEESGESYSEMVSTDEPHYAGISATVLFLFCIWIVVLILGIMYIPLLIIIDVIPLVILVIDNGYGIDMPIMRVFFGMLIPATIMLFGWRVKE